mgnify:CR=1 FL=1
MDRVWTIVKVSGDSYLRYIATDKVDRVLGVLFEDLKQNHEVVQVAGTVVSNKKSASGVVLQFLCDHPDWQQPYENVICSGP